MCLRVKVVNSFPLLDSFSFYCFGFVYLFSINSITIAAILAFSTKCTVVVWLGPGAQILCETLAVLHSQLAPNILILRFTLPLFWKPVAPGWQSTSRGRLFLVQQIPESSTPKVSWPKLGFISHDRREVGRDLKPNLPRPGWREASTLERKTGMWCWRM